MVRFIDDPTVAIWKDYNVTTIIYRSYRDQIVSHTRDVLNVVQLYFSNNGVYSGGS